MEKKELEILSRFIEKGTLKGRFLGPDVAIEKLTPKRLKNKLKELKGISPKTAEERRKIRELTAKMYVPKKIDSICVTSKEVWILEVERKLTPTAIGQVIEYEFLYKRKYPERKKKIRLGIVCEVADEKFSKWLESAYNIKIFVV